MGQVGYGHELGDVLFRRLQEEAIRLYLAYCTRRDAQALHDYFERAHPDMFDCHKEMVDWQQRAISGEPSGIYEIGRVLPFAMSKIPLSQCGEGLNGAEFAAAHLFLKSAA